MFYFIVIFKTQIDKDDHVPLVEVLLGRVGLVRPTTTSRLILPRLIGHFIQTYYKKQLNKVVEKLRFRGPK